MLTVLHLIPFGHREYVLIGRGAKVSDKDGDAQVECVQYPDGDERENAGEGEA